MSTFSQVFPPRPDFTERQVKDLRDHVYIVTGATSGVGFELAKILYSHNATVFVGGRSSQSTSQAIRQIKKSAASSSGRAEPIIMDLADLASVQAGAKKFLEEERRLDVLFHNAGVMTPPADSKSKDGYDLELATNCLAPFLLTSLLKPVLASTAQSSGGARVVFVSSMVNVGTPEGGVVFDKRGNPKQMKGMDNYMQSKAGELFLAKEFSRAWADTGIISVSCHPGLMKTNLQRNSPPPQRVIMSILFKGPKYGAYTELFAGLSPKVRNGEFYIPWGRLGSVPDHLVQSMSPGSKGKAISETFFDWCEENTSQYLKV